MNRNGNSILSENKSNLLLVWNALSILLHYKCSGFFIKYPYWECDLHPGKKKLNEPRECLFNLLFRSVDHWLVISEAHCALITDNTVYWFCHNIWGAWHSAWWHTSMSSKIHYKSVLKATNWKRFVPFLCIVTKLFFDFRSLLRRSWESLITLTQLTVSGNSVTKYVHFKLDTAESPEGLRFYWTSQ